MKLFVAAKAILIHEGKVLLLQEAAYNEGTNEGKWDVPGGRIDPQEPLLEGLVREIKEETGLENMRIGDVLGVYESFGKIKEEDCHIIRVYYAVYMDNKQPVILSADHTLYEWITLEESTERQLMSNIKQLLHKVLG